MNRVVIYHDNCQDGFGAAFAFYKHGQQFDREYLFVPGQYGKPLPEVVEGAIVYLADFSYKLPQMKELLEKAAAVVLLDHHKSAIDELILGPDNLVGHPKFSCDKCTTEWSGAAICWDYLFPQQLLPLMIRHISDRDCWKFELDWTEEFCEYLFSKPYDFRAWDEVFTEDFTNEELYLEVCKIGEGMLSAKNKMTQEIRNSAMMTGVIGGVPMPITNASYHFASGLGDLNKRTFDASASYFINKDGEVVFSLRSAQMDVQEIAKLYGGGGHKNAAGFKTTFKELMNILGAAQ